MNPRLRSIVVAWLVALFVAVIVASCSMEKRCAKCPLKVERHDSITVEVRDRPVTVYVHDTITKSLPNPCAELCDENGKLKKGFDKTLQGSKPGTRGHIFTRNDSLHFEMILEGYKAEGIAKDSLIKKLTLIHEQVPARCQKEHLSKWDSFFIVSGRIGWCILGLVGIGWYLQRRRRATVS